MSFISENNLGRGFWEKVLDIVKDIDHVKLALILLFFIALAAVWFLAKAN